MARENIPINKIKNKTICAICEFTSNFKTRITTLWCRIKNLITTFYFNHRPWFLDSYAVADYLLEKISSRNYTMFFNELYCYSCNKPVLIVNESITLKDKGYLNNKRTFRIVNISGDCIECRSMVTRFSTDWRVLDFLDYYNKSNLFESELSNQDEKHSTISLFKIIWIMWRTFMPKIFNYQKIRQDSIYTVNRIHEELGPSKSTVKYWVHENGLQPIDIDDSPWLFEGTVLKEFLKKKKDKFKVKLKPGECYCLSCRKGARILTKSIQLVYTGKKLGNAGVAQIIIKGKCKKCGKTAIRLSSENKVDEFLAHYPNFNKKNSEDN